KMWPLPIQDLLFVGKSTAKRLHSLGIHTIGALAQSDPILLQNHLGKMGLTAWQYANGHCSDDEFSHTPETKGYSNATTLSEDITDAVQAKEILLSLCETVASRLRYDKKKAGVVSVTIRNTDFEDHSRQTSLYSNTNVTQELYVEVSRLFDELWDHTPIRLLGVATAKAEEGTSYQYDLFDNGKHEKLEKLDAAIDKVRARYGDDSIKRATLLNNTYKPRRK
ncbi:MAG: DNA polymerase IV, partial [Lachnospiraceae bacterium]|nr:DNA polymerase IV [Lachnospiraceae bacterium]